MKSLLIFLIFFCAKVRCFKGKQIEGIEGHVKSIDFDMESNTYVVVHANESSYLYKIDGEKNISYTQKFEFINKVHINSNGDLYVFEKTEWYESKKELSETTTPRPRLGCRRAWDGMIHCDDGLSELYPRTTTTTAAPVKNVKYTLWIMEKNSSKLSKLNYWEGDYKFKSIMDEDGNLIFTTNNGIVMMKPKRNVPIALMDVSITDEIDSLEDDENGNIYVKMKNSGNNLLKNESKNEEVPEIQYLPVVINKHFDIGTNGGDIYFAATEKNGKSTLVKLIGPIGTQQFKILHSQHQTAFNFFYRTEDRLFLTGDISGKDFSILFVTRDDKVVAVDEIFEYPLLTSENLCVSDSLGNVFFVRDEIILSIKHNETEVTKIISPSGKKISSVLVDGNDDLWVLAENLYYYKNGTSDAIWVANLPGEEDSPMKENEKTEEIFVGSGTGLSFFVNDKL